MQKLDVLVVEDVEIVQKLIKITLIGLGCNVDVAGNGAEALQLYQENQYDLVFMDLGLPDIDGKEVTKRMRQINKEPYVMIVALTAHASPEQKTLCFEAGMDDFLQKPLTEEIAQTILEKVMKMQSPRFSNG